MDNGAAALEAAGDLAPVSWIKEGLQEEVYHEGPEVGRPRPSEGIRGQDILRLVRQPPSATSPRPRSGPRGPGPRRLEALLAGPEHHHLQLPREGQHPLPHNLLARDADGARRHQPPLRRGRAPVLQLRGRRRLSKSRNWGVSARRSSSQASTPDIWRYYLTYLIPETRGHRASSGTSSRTGSTTSSSPTSGTSSTAPSLSPRTSWGASSRRPSPARRRRSSGGRSSQRSTRRTRRWATSDSATR